MKGLDYGVEVKQSEEELKRLLKTEDRALQRRRLRFLLLLKSGKCSSQAQAGAAIGLQHRGAQKLWQLYSKEGMAGVLRPPGSGRPSKLSGEAKATLDTALAQSKLSTLRQAAGLLHQNHGISISVQGVHYYFKAQKIKKKTGRPSNVRKDEEGAEAFKKKGLPK